MCGIAGCFVPSTMRTSHELESLVSRMTGAVAHRGPDDQGLWVDAHHGVALGHRRLSIIDLSLAGHQPMLSHTGRYIIAFNGEIYNYRELKAELEQASSQASHLRFQGSSDTEVMLAAFDCWGVEGAIPKFNGMFAFAVWDQQARSLILARDRCGEKPLYYGWAGDEFVFGSELKALRVHPKFQSAISRHALVLFMRFGYVPTPYSIYENVWKLPPASILRIDTNSEVGTSPAASEYWSLEAIAESGCRNQLTLDDAAATNQLDTLLTDSVKLRMVADVPLGAFLSGGIDSSTIVALMQKCSNRPVRTFTIGLRESNFNEAAFAEKVAAHLGCEHTELYVTHLQAIDAIGQLPVLYDEPFADSSQIPTYLVSRLARQHVTISLSGDGGDEIFGGYNRYQWADAFWRNAGGVPVRARRQLARLLQRLPYPVWQSILGVIEPMLPASVQLSNPADKLQKIASNLPADSRESLYLGLVSQWTDPMKVVRGVSQLPDSPTPLGRWPQLPDFIHEMMYMDSVTYLPDDILVKLDRASMGVGLETRVPFLDHRIVEFSWQLPRKMKFRNGQTKWLLKQVLSRYVPARLTERPKAGFGIPIHEWLRGPLRDWAEALIEPDRLQREGYLDPEPVRQKWVEHLTGKYNHVHALWNVLMFQLWLEHERSRSTDRESAAQVYVG